MSERCRHRDSWLIAGGSYEWCYRCGALRNMRETGIAQVSPESPWCKPVGATAPNPWNVWDGRRTAYIKRREAKR
jgi:hypothetical protein